MVRCVVARRSLGQVRRDLLLQIDPSASDPKGSLHLEAGHPDPTSHHKLPLQSDSLEDPRGYNPSRSFPSE